MGYESKIFSSLNLSSLIAFIALLVSLFCQMIDDDDNNKLSTARQELHKRLITITQRLTSQPDRPQTVNDIKVLTAAPPSQIYSSHDGCSASDASSEGYRCKCSFQLEPVSSVICTDQEDQSTKSPHDLMYCIREHGDIIPLQDGIFPPANRRISHAMVELLKSLNSKQSSGIYQFRGMRNNLTSVTFVSSWGDGAQNALSGDCHVTLHYGPPGVFNALTSSDIAMTAENQYNDTDWKKEAEQVCNKCNLSSLTARSKGIKLTAFNPLLAEEEDSNERIIHDDIWITMQQNDIVSVSLVPPTLLSTRITHNIKVQYQKSTEAFQHPNAGVMLTSLHWILNTLSRIAKQSTAKPSLLEMYCGCGAHTIPCAKSSLLSEIVAVELDERLVAACKNNCLLNNCLKGENDRAETEVSVSKGDAATFAKKALMSYKKEITSGIMSNDGAMNFDILLVDPPREGLDHTVCDLALKGQFKHMIYISCGRRALLRDLETLCVGGFHVSDLAVIDLFPGTDAVESLVLLERGSTENEWDPEVSSRTS
jgi:16S rRNA G966 N2-methylase RsmD